MAREAFSALARHGEGQAHLTMPYFMEIYAI